MIRVSVSFPGLSNSRRERIERFLLIQLLRILAKQSNQLVFQSCGVREKILEGNGPNRVIDFKESVMRNFNIIADQIQNVVIQAADDAVAQSVHDC